MWSKLFGGGGPLSEEQFFQVFLKHVRYRVPNVTMTMADRLNEIVIVGGPTADPIPFNLMLAYRELNGNPKTDRKRFQRLVDAIVEVATRTALQRRGAKFSEILPVLRSRAFLQQMGLKLDEMPHRPLGEHAAVVYVADSKDHMTYIAPVDWKPVDPVRLHQEALTNLERMERRFLWREDGVSGLLECDGDYESSHLLNEPMWREVEQRLGPSLTIFVPCNNCLLFVDSRNQPAVDTYFQFARTTFRENSRPVSPQMFLRRNGKIEAF